MVIMMVHNAYELLNLLNTCTWVLYKSRNNTADGESYRKWILLYFKSQNSWELLPYNKWKNLINNIYCSILSCCSTEPWPSTFSVQHRVNCKTCNKRLIVKYGLKIIPEITFGFGLLYLLPSLPSPWQIVYTHLRSLRTLYWLCVRNLEQ